MEDEYRPKELSAVEYADEPKRESKLPLVQQDKAIAELLETIKIFEDRLRPVLTPKMKDSPVEATAEDKPAMSPLADKLLQNNRSIGRATNMIYRMMERLEV